ncbi:class III signal peptide-containing protein [Methanocaldococcus sp.]
MKGQISFEFVLIVVGIILISIIYIVNFLSNNLTSTDFDLIKIDNRAKEAINLLNYGYNGTEINGTLFYIGMKWEKINNSFANVYIGIGLKDNKLNDETKTFIENFILNYIYSANINKEKYNITIYLKTL